MPHRLHPRLSSVVMGLLVSACRVEACPRPPTQGASAEDRSLRAVDLSELRTTQGRLTVGSGALQVEGSRLRAVGAGPTPELVELEFTPIGGMPEAALPLGSGELRRQVGLKLRAQDTCNLLYVMWRIEPVASVVVQLKLNPGKRRHAECGNKGYRTLKPDQFQKVVAPASGVAHRLRVAQSGQTLKVWADGTLVWEGTLSTEVLALQGPVGVRTDNGRFGLVLRVPKELRRMTPTTSGSTEALDEGD